MIEIKMLGTELKILWDGVIGEDIMPADAQAVVDRARLADSVVIQLNSAGGYITDGWAIFNILKPIRDKLTIETIGLSASMASVIALAGTKHIMRQGTYFMIHEPWSGVIGTADDMRDTAEVLDMMKMDIIKLYESKTALTHDEVIKMMKDETWMTASEALDYGFANEIDEALPMAACISDKLKFNKIPTIFTNTMSEETKSENKEEIKIMDEIKNEINVDEIVNQVMAKIPAGRTLDVDNEASNKIDKWFADYLVNRTEPKNATVKTSDGYGVPTLVDAEVFKRRSLGSFMRKEVEGLSPAKIRKYSADTKVVAKVNPTAAIIAEGADYANGSDKGSTVTFDSIKIGSIYSATEEISEESLINVVADFQDDAGRALAKLENQYFVVGTGSDEPQGMVTGGTLYQDASGGLTTSGFSATVGLAYDALVSFDEKLPEEYRDGSFYMMKSTTRAALRKIVDSNKRPILQEYASGLFSLFGRPVIINDNMDGFGANKKVILLGNREAYGIGDRASGLKVRVSENTQNGDTEVRWSLRTDGKVLDATAFQVLQCPAS